MDLSHYYYLYPAYFTALIGWLIYEKYFIIQSETVGSSKMNRQVDFNKPMLEFIYALIAVVGVLLIGQLFIRGYLFKGGILAKTLNQVIIFLPIFLLLPIRGHSLETALIPKTGKIKSVCIGFALSILALFIFLGLKGYNLNEMINAFTEIFLNKDNLDELVQVFAEDFAISVLLFRLVTWIGLTKSVVIVATLFAAGHIPAMISYGVELNSFCGLVLDLLLGVMMLRTVYKSGNFMWFWVVHFTMDMTQFLA